MKKLFLFLLVGIFFLSFASAFDNSLQTDILRYYQLNETSGTTAVDSTNNANGTINSSTTLGITGKIEKAYNFTSINAMVTMGAKVNVTSFNFWIFPQNYSASKTIFFNPADNHAIYVEVGGYLRIFRNPSDLNTTIKAPLNQWSMITARHNGTGYLVSVNNGTEAYIVTATILVNEFGGRSTTGAQNYNGAIDEIGLWNKTLSLDERNTLYNNTFGYIYYSVTTPSVTLNAPADASSHITYRNVTFNWTSTIGSGNIVNSTLFINGTANETITVGPATATNTTVKRFSTGAYSWLVQSCSTTVCGNSSSRTFSVYPVILNSNSYTTPVTEGTLTTLIGNFSTYNVDIATAYLNYSGTLYPATVSGSSGEYLVTRSITTPTVSGTSIKSFNWYVILDDAFTFNSSFANQTVNDFVIDNCSTYSVYLYNFTMKDETNQNILNQTTLNTLGRLNFLLYLNDGTTLMQNYSTSYNRTNPFQVCMSGNLSSGENYILDGQVQYSADGYVSEFYNIQDENITSADIHTNVSLYDLNDTIAQEFLITYTDENFQAVEDALIFVDRKYIDEGVFKTVEIPITDANGQSLANLVLSDVIYTFRVIKNGVLLGTFENVVAFCDNIATGDCTIDLNSYSTTTAPDTFADLDDYIFRISYNETTRIASSSFSVASGSSATNMLNVTLFDGYGTTQVCTDSLVSASGTLTCTVPSTYENSTITIALYKDGTIKGLATIDQSATPDEVYGASRVFIAVVSFLILIGIGISEGTVITSILLILGAIMLVTFNMMSSAGIIGSTATVLWFIVAVILVMIKGGRR